MAKVTPRERQLFIAFWIVVIPLLVVALFVLDHATKPRGTRVATIDLLSDANEVTIQATAGAKIRFSVDVEARLGNSEIVDLMEAMRLTVTLVDPGRADRTSNCAAYAGSSHGTPNSSQNIQYRKGVEVTCELAVESSGPARVRVRTDWPKGPRPLRATLAVRLGDERTYP